jgi:hypothetical protein
MVRREMTESLPELCNQKVIMRFEWFTIREFDGHHLWLEIDGGEGMQFRKDELMGFLSKIWKRF